MGDTREEREGNTIPSRSRCRAWFFTENQPEVENLTHLTQLSGGPEWCGQLEVGENGKRHLQFCVRYKNARSFESVKKQFPRCHIERCIDWLSSVRYVTKSESRVSGPWASSMELLPKLEYAWKPTRKPFVPVTWQRELIEELTTTGPHARRVIWYSDPIGGSGKTEMATWFGSMYPGVHLVSGRIEDVMYTIARKWVDKKTRSTEREEPELRVVFFDLPRSQEHVSYRAIEQVKNGVITSTKYESQTLILSIPHVVVFANWEPDRTKLSADRWSVRHLRGSGEYEEEQGEQCT